MFACCREIQQGPRTAGAVKPGEESDFHKMLRALIHGRGYTEYHPATDEAAASGLQGDGHVLADETRSQASLREIVHGHGMPFYGTPSAAELRELIHGRGLPVYETESAGAAHAIEVETSSEAELRELIHGRGLPVYGTAAEAGREVDGGETSSEAMLRELIHGRGLPFYGKPSGVDHEKKHLYEHEGDEHVHFIDGADGEGPVSAPRSHGTRRPTPPARSGNLPESAGDKEIQCKMIVKPPSPM